MSKNVIILEKKEYERLIQNKKDVILDFLSWFYGRVDKDDEEVVNDYLKDSLKITPSSEEENKKIKTCMLCGKKISQDAELCPFCIEKIIYAIQNT